MAALNAPKHSGNCVRHRCGYGTMAKCLGRRSRTFPRGRKPPPPPPPPPTAAVGRQGAGPKKNHGPEIVGLPSKPGTAAIKLRRRGTSRGNALLATGLRAAA